MMNKEQIKILAFLKKKIIEAIRIALVQSK